MASPLPNQPNISDPRFLEFCDFLRKVHLPPPIGIDEGEYADHLAVHEVAVDPLPGCATGHCWYNCLEQQVAQGGQAVFGWALWQHEQNFIAQYHAVWKNEQGQYLDPTPNQSGTATALFMPDNRVPFDIDRLRIAANLEWTDRDNYVWFAGEKDERTFFVSRMMLTFDLKDRVERLRRQLAASA